MAEDQAPPERSGGRTPLSVSSRAMMWLPLRSVRNLRYTARTTSACSGWIVSRPPLRV